MSSNIIPGRYKCFCVGNVVEFFTTDKGEPKIIINVVVETVPAVDGTEHSAPIAAVQVESKEYMTIDPDLVTANQKRRIEFTLSALRGLGAADPLRDISAALAKGETSATIEGLGSTWADCEAKDSGQYVNLNIYAPRVLDVGKGKSLAEKLAKLGQPGVASKAANPFEVPAPKTTAPRVAVAGPARAPAPKATEDTSFPFGANAPAPAS